MIRLLLILCGLASAVTRTHQDLIDLVGRKGDITHLYDLYQRAPHLSPMEFGAKCNGTAGDFSAFRRTIDSAARSGEAIILPPATCRIESTLTIGAANNGLTIRGAGQFNSTLKFTGSGDGFLIGGNLNGLLFSDFRLTGNGQGRSAIVIDTGTISATPDAGVFTLARLDIRDWLLHGIVQRLTVDTHTDNLGIVGNGGTAILFKTASPTKATTWTDVGSWFHENGGHGVVLDGPLSVTLFGTIMDSNNGASTDSTVIRYAGYTLTLQAGGYANCVAADLGRVVTRNAVSIGTLAHYDNDSREWVINATDTIPSGGTLAITSGTGAGTGTARRKNSHGLYARNTQGLHLYGGHIENQIYGTFLDNAYDGVIAPGYVVTQGIGAWGHYAASTTTRIAYLGSAIDVQAGGAGDIYFGPLTIAPMLMGGHGGGGYTFTNRSQNALVTTAENASGLYSELRSTDQEPQRVHGYDATWAALRIDGKAGGKPAVRYYTSGTLSAIDAVGAGTPEGVIAAPVGSTYRRTDGGAGTALYVKESGAGNTGWVAK